MTKNDAIFALNEAVRSLDVMRARAMEAEARLAKGRRRIAALRQAIEDMKLERLKETA